MFSKRHMLYNLADLGFGYGVPILFGYFKGCRSRQRSGPEFPFVRQRIKCGDGIRSNDDNGLSSRGDLTAREKNIDYTVNIRPCKFAYGH